MSNNKKLKICHVITRMIVGGAQENTLLSVIGLMEKGHDVTLVTGPSPGPEGELLKQTELTSKFDIKIVKVPHLVRWVDPLRDIMTYHYLKGLFMTEKYDVVHTHSSKAGILGRAAACSAKTKFIVHTIHGQAFHAYGNPLSNWLYKKAEWWAAKRCHAIFAVAQAMIDQCIDAHITRHSKFKLVYSGMELEPFLNNEPDIDLRNRLGIPENSPVIGTVARLFPLKGYEYFIPAAAKIAKEIPNVRFLIIGNGILKDKLEKQISRLGLKNNFIFSGLVPPADVYKYISLMNILIHLSLREGLPRAVVQALASGKPAIGYELDGTPEVIIDGKTGYISKPKEIDSVAESAIKLLKNPTFAEKLGKNGRKLVEARFGWRQMVRTLEREYYKGLEEFKDMWKY